MNGVPVPNHPAGSWKDGLSLNHRQAFATSLVESLKKIPIGGPPERIAKYAQQTENNAFDTAQSREEYFAIMRERIEYVRNTVDRRRNAVLNNNQVVPQGQSTHQSQPAQAPQPPLPSQHQAQFVPQQRPPEDVFNTMPMNQQTQQINPVAQFQQQPPQVQQPLQGTGQTAVPNVSGNQPQYNAAYENALRQLMSQQQHQQHQQQQQQQQNQQGRNIPIGMRPQQGQASISSQVTPQSQQQNAQTPRNAALLAMMQQQQARMQAQAQQGNVTTQQQQQSNQQIAQQIRQRLAQNGGRNNPTELQAMLQMLKQQQQRQQQAPQLQQQDQTAQQIPPPSQQQQDSQTSISMQQVRSATGQLMNDGNTPNNYSPIQQAQVQMFRKLVQAQKQQQQEQQSAVAGQIQQSRQMGLAMNATAQQPPMMLQNEQPIPGTQQQQIPQQPQQPLQQQNVMPRNGPHQRIATAQSAGRTAAIVQQAEQGQPQQPQLTRQQLDSTVKNYVLKSKIPQALLKMMPFLPSDVNTWTQIYNLMKSNSIPSDALPIIRNVHAQNEQLVRNLFTKQGQQAQRLANDASMPVGQRPIAVPGVIQQAAEDAKSSPVMINQQPTNQRPGAPGPKIDGSPSLPRVAMTNLPQHQLPQGSQPQQSTMNQQASMTIPHQYSSGQSTTPVMQQQQQQEAQMMYNNILSQSPQRKQTTPTIQHSQMPPHQPSQQNQWMVDAQQSQQQAAAQQLQEPLQPYIQQQNPAGQFGAEGAANVQRPSYGPEQQERDRTRIRELYEEVSRSRAKQSPVELLPEDQTKTREMILQLQEACRQMDRLIHWAHVNFHNESVTKRLIAMQFAYREQFEVLNRGIFYFTPESIAKFRVELSKFFNYVRRHQQLKQGNGGVALPMNMGMSTQQSASGSQVLQQQSQQAVAQGTPQQQIQQSQQLQVPPRRPPQPPMMMSTMPQQGGQQMSFEPNLAFAAQQQRQRQGNTDSTPTTANTVPPQQRPMQQQQPMMSQSQQQQAVSAGSFPAQQFVPQSMPGATPVSAPIPAPNARQPARRNQKATVVAATQSQLAVTAANNNAHSTPQNLQTSQRPNFSSPGQATVMPQAQLGMSGPGATAPEPSPVISSSASPQGVPIYTPTPLVEATQLKLPQNRKRPLGGMTSSNSTGTSPTIGSEPPLKKEKAEPKAGPKSKQTTAQAKAAAAQAALALAAEDANAKQRAVDEEVARKRRELAEKDPLGYALQALADICGVDPQTGKDIKETESSTTGILSQMKIMYSKILRGIC
ncbi:uncharacterized protein V1513DRAFT_444787 [Lipomyces chichibuensis]|uniref:uncharacterized protein n=1 Tax=Lipomyces chichibuensis TaxID=1546026 RepID=UPI00334366ED